MGMRVNSGRRLELGGRLLRRSLAPCLVALMLLSAGATCAAGSSRVPIGFSRQEVAGALLLHKAPHSPGMGAIFAVMLAGAGDQRPHETHCAHVAEHMVFRNPLTGGRSLFELVRQAGGRVNGWSGPLHTQFEVAVPHELIPEALRWLVEALFPLCLCEQAFREEIHARMVRDLEYMTTSRVAAAMNAFHEQVYRGTVYEQRLFDVPVTTVTMDAVASFMAREYSPQRLMIVVVANVEEATLVTELNAALNQVPVGPPPARRQVSLAPPPIGHLRLPGFGKPLVLVGLAVDGIEEDDGPLLALGLHLALSRLLAAPPPGLRPRRELTVALRLEGAFCLAVAFEGAATLTAARLERLAEEATHAVRNAAAEFAAGGPDEGQLLELLEAVERASEAQAAPSGIPPYNEAYLAGVTLIPTYQAYSRAPDDFVSEPGAIGPTLARYLPRATCTVLVVSAAAGMAPALIIGAAVLAVAGVILGLALGRWKRRTRRPAVSPPERE
ncbi:MAG: insulinase family protein [bacterium]|nr:insulinase family protein [bacterium]